MHVDDFIDTAYLEHTYARFVLNYMRLPAALQIDFKPYMEDCKLFCTYQGVRYRVTMASRNGWLGLHSDHERDAGYEHRADVDDCSDWSSEP